MKKVAITKIRNEAISAIKDTVEKAAVIVGSTMGPYGSNSLNETAWGTHLTKDGASVLANLNFEDPFENAVLNVVKDAVFKSNHEAGDGTTGTLVFIDKILQKVLPLRSIGYNGIQLGKGINLAATEVVNRLRKSSIKLDDDLSVEKNYKTLYDVAMISTNGDEELSRIFTDIFKACGKGANIKLENSGSQDTTYKIIEGYQVDFGYVSQYFADNTTDRALTLTNPDIYVSAEPVDNIPDIMPIVNIHIRNGKPLVIFAPNFDTSVLNTLILSKAKGLKVCCIKVNSVKQYFLEDISKVVGGALLSAKTGLTFRTDPNVMNINLCGHADSITITENSTIILGGHSNQEVLDMHLNALKAQLERNKNSREDAVNFTERIEKIQGGIAVIYIGAQTAVKARERYDLAEDSFNACRVALEGGIQPGGGIAIARHKVSYDILEEIEDKYDKTSAIYLGAKALIDSLDATFEQILKNTAFNTSRLLDSLIQSTCDTYDLRKIDQDNRMRIGNAFELGVIDPEIVLENELINAASCASSLCSIESITVNKKSDNSIAEAISNLA